MGNGIVDVEDRFAVHDIAGQCQWDIAFFGNKVDTAGRIYRLEPDEIERPIAIADLSVAE
jgi:hypothetical protein